MPSLPCTLGQIYNRCKPTVLGNQYYLSKRHFLMKKIISYLYAYIDNIFFISQQIIPC